MIKAAEVKTERVFMHHPFLAIVCFDTFMINCQIFDGKTVSKITKTNKRHKFGEVGVYKGRPIAIGGTGSAEGAVETFTKNGWKNLESHPR